MKKILLLLLSLNYINTSAQHKETDLNKKVASFLSESPFYLKAANYEIDVLKANGHPLLYESNNGKRIYLPLTIQDEDDSCQILIFQTEEYVYVIGIRATPFGRTSEVVALEAHYVEGDTTNVYSKELINGKFNNDLNWKLHVNKIACPQGVFTYTETDLFSFTLPGYDGTFYVPFDYTGKKKKS